MAELEIFGIEEWIRELENLGQDVPKITKEALKAGAGVFKQKLEISSPEDLNQINRHPSNRGGMGNTLKMLSKKVKSLKRRSLFH